MESGNSESGYSAFFGRSIGHGGYSLANLKSFVEQPQLCDTTISKHMYLNINQTALARIDGNGEKLTLQALTLVVNVLQDMYDRNVPIFSADVFAAMSMGNRVQIDDDDAPNNPGCFEWPANSHSLTSDFGCSYPKP
jgi:hypothetical protein